MKDVSGFYTLFWCFHCWLRKSKCRLTLPEKWPPNTEFFLVRIFPHSDWIRRDMKNVQIRTRKNSVFRHFTQCEYLVCSLLMVFYFLYKLIVLAFSMFAQVISFVQITWALTHYNSVLLTYIPWKHQKTFRFFDVFRGNR